MSIEWADVPGFSGRYQASREGRIRVAKSKRPYLIGRILSPGIDSTGYYEIVCIVAPDGTRKTCRVHRLIAITFLGEPPFPGAVVRHLDGDSRNNAVSNLSWGSVSENAVDTIRHGRNRYAARGSCDKGHPYVDGSHRLTLTSSGGVRRRCIECENARGVLRRDKRRAFRAENPTPARTHCDRGHDWILENIYTSPSGSQTCSICKQATAARWRTNHRRHESS